MTNHLVAALFVDPNGPYGYDARCDRWDEKRDARLYGGPLPVVAHPPCNVWCCLAKANQTRYGIPWGRDDGLFASALASVNRWGGVLEHPALSLAWPVFGLTKPIPGRWTKSGVGWVTACCQSAYGHKCRKRTWLYYRGAVEPEAPDWSEPQATHQISRSARPLHQQLSRLPQRLAHITPPAFAHYLVGLAIQSNTQPSNRNELNAGTTPSTKRP